MEITEILEQIKDRWKSSNRYGLIYKLEQAPVAASTGTEGLVLIGEFLLELKNSDAEAFAEINDLIDQYILNCANKHRIRFRE